MNNNQPPYIELKNVQVEYPGYVTGLKNVSLQIQKGDFVFFVGKTGAGKSTLIKILTREIAHTSGIVTLGGRDLGQLKEREIPALRREMGIVPQDFALLPRKRVWENVAYAMRAVGHTRAEVRSKVPSILESVNIGHRADAFPHQLSGGEQQRVAIARALINNPPLLIADEPTGNLDPERSWEIMELLKALNLKGTTILVASHDMMVIHRMGKRIVTLDGGQILNDSGDLERDYTHPKPESKSTLPQDEIPAEPSTPVELEASEVVVLNAVESYDGNPTEEVSIGEEIKAEDGESDA